MAILKNLIVNGASRFLQKAYFDDIAVSGTTTISNLSATTLTVSGQTTLNGATDVKNTFNIKNTDHAVNFYFSPTGSAYTSRIYESSPSTGVYQLNVDNNLNVKTNLSASNLIISNKSNFGGKVKVDGDVDILGNLRWSTVGEHMTIQNLGGTLLVAPTIRQSNTIKIFINGITGTEVNMTIYDPAISGTDDVNNIFTAGGASWSAGSLIKVSGKIGECVLGACDGSITTINLQNSQMTVRIIVPNADQLDTSKNSLNNAYTSTDITDFSIMMYKVNVNSNLYPIGLVLTSYGDNYKSYIDVFGGTDAGPVARMGNLGGLTYDNYSSNTTVTLENQWGFYAKGNAYFQGHIETNAGSIGGWKITSDGLSKGTLGTTNSIFLVPSGKTTANSIGGSNDTTLPWAITSSNTFGVTTTGTLYCSSGKLAGWVIDTDSIRSGAKTSTSAGAVTLSTTNFTRTLITHGSVQNLRFAVGNRFGINQNGVLYADSVILSGDITATAGSIGNWNISDGQLLYTVNSTDTIGSSGSAFLIPGGSTSTADIGGSGSISGWTFTSDSTFGVTNTGAMYCTSGKIGGWSIDSDSIFSGEKIRDAVNGLIPASNGDVRLSTTDFSRAIGEQNRNYLRFAIGPNFAVSRAGNAYMSNVFADKLTAYRSFKIYGELPAIDPISGRFDPNDGYSPYTFEFIRAAGATKNDKSYRNVCIGTTFLEEDVTTWKDVRPAVGISIVRDLLTDNDVTESYISIHGKTINLAGEIYQSSDGQTSGQTRANVQVRNGDLIANDGFISALHFSMPVGIDGGAQTGVWKATCVKAVSKDTEYTLTNGHIYLLITWHNDISGTATRGAWIFRGGSTFYMKLDTFHGTSGNSATSTGTGSRITITLTSTTMKFTTSASPSSCRLIDLG